MKSLTDAARSSVSSAQHPSSVLTLILSNSCTAAFFVPVWSLAVISGLLTSNTYVPLSIGVRHRFLKDSSETHGLSRVFRLKNRIYTSAFQLKHIICLSRDAPYVTSCLSQVCFKCHQLSGNSRIVQNLRSLRSLQIRIYAFLNCNTVALAVNLILFA